MIDNASPKSELKRKICNAVVKKANGFEEILAIANEMETSDMAKTVNIQADIQC